MNAATQELCLNLLAGMNSKQDWNEHVASVYALAMEGWDDDLALEAVKWAALNERWRPAPVELRAIAARRAAPPPSASAALTEVRRLICYHGSRAGSAPHSHPVIAAVADELGGWAEIGRRDAGELDAAFGGAFARAATTWQENAGPLLLQRSTATERLTAPGLRLIDSRLGGEVG